MITQFNLFESSIDIPDLICILSLNKTIFTVGRVYPIEHHLSQFSTRIKNDKGTVVSIYDNRYSGMAAHDFVKIKIDTLKNNGYNIPSNLKLYTTWKVGEFVIFSDETIDQYQKRLKEEQFDL